MVRVVSAHHFLSQSIQTCEVPYAATTAPPDRLLLALSHHVEVSDLSSEGEAKFSFPTVDQSYFLAYCAAGCFIRQYATRAVQVKKVKKNKLKEIAYPQELLNYFSHSKPFNEELSNISRKLLVRKPKQTENLYLFDDRVANIIVDLFKKDIISNGVPIFESSSGLGLLTKKLLKAGASSVRIFEMDPNFKNYAQKLVDNNPGKVKYFQNNFLQLWKLTYQDLMDNGDRLQKLMDGVEVKKWNDEPVLNFIGVLTNSTFLRHIVFSIIFQSGVITYGRPELYTLLTPGLFLQMREDKECGRYQNRTFTILCSLFFDFHFYGTIDRLAYLPWQNVTDKTKRMCDIYNLDVNKLYLTRLSPKKDLYQSVPKNMLKPLWFFIKYHLSNRNTRVIPMMEQWVPGCGPHLIKSGFDVYSLFSELSTKQILDLFLDFTSWPEFQSCPFIPAMETTTVKMETPSDLEIDTDGIKFEDDQSNAESN